MRAPVTPDEPEPDRPSFAQPSLTWTGPATIIRSWIGVAWPLRLRPGAATITWTRR